MYNLDQNIKRRALECLESTLVIKKTNQNILQLENVFEKKLETKYKANLLLQKQLEKCENDLIE